MFTIKLKTITQADNVKDFLLSRAGLAINVDYKIECWADKFEVPSACPFGEQMVWKFDLYDEDDSFDFGNPDSLLPTD